MLNKKSINTMSRDEIYNTILSTVTSIYKSLEYLNLSKEEYKKIVLNAIDMSKEKYHEDISYTKFIEQSIQKLIIEHMTEKLTDQKICTEILNNYINNKFIKIKTYKDALKYFDNLSVFFSIYNINSNIDLIIDLIKTNKTFEKMLILITKHYYNKIVNGEIESVIENNLLAQSVETYCILEDIDINEKDCALEKLPLGNTTEIDRMYFQEMTRIQLLTPEQEKEICLKIKEGDTKAKKKLIESNLRLVANIAFRYMNRGMELMDLIQEGNMGLMKAVDRFEVDKGFKFSTYATWWIRQAITRALADQSRAVRLPVHLNEKIAKYRKTVGRLSSISNTEPTIEEVAREMKMSPQKVSKLAQVQTDVISINTKIYEDNDIELGDLIESDNETPEDVIIKRRFKEDILKLMDKCFLTDREKDVLMCRCGFITGEPMTLEEIGQKYNVGRERIRQIESRALTKISLSPHADAFAEYTDNPDKALEKLKDFRRGHTTSLKAKYEERTGIPKTIYETFKDYSKEEIDTAVAKLPEVYMQIIRLRFGDDFNVPFMSQLNEEQSRVYYSIYQKLKKSLKNPNYKISTHYKTIYENFSDYSKEEIDKVLKKLTKKEKELITLKYGEDLTKVFLSKLDKKQTASYNNLRRKIIRLLENPDTKKGPKTIYDYFEDFSSKEVTMALSNLSSKDWEIIRLRFGEDLDQPFESDLDNNQKIELYSTIAKIRRRLNNPNKKLRGTETIYERFSDFSKEEIDAVIAGLSDDDKKIITLKYGEDLEQPHKSSLTQKQNSRFQYIMRKVNTNLLKMHPELTGKLKTIYQYFEDYTKEEVDIMLSKLTPRDKEIIRLKYGEDLTIPFKGELTEKQRAAYYSLNTKMKKLLNGQDFHPKQHWKTVYEQFPDYTKEQVNAVISLLTDDEKEVLKLKFGEDLEERHKAKLNKEERSKTQVLVKKIGRFLKNGGSRETISSRIKTIYQYFGDYSKEEVDKVLETLSDKDKQLIRLKYGEDLTVPYKSPLDKNQNNLFYACIAPKIKRGLTKTDTGAKKARRKVKTIYQYLDGYTKEEIDTMLTKLSPKEKELIELKYGEDLTVPFESQLDKKQKARFYNSIAPKMKKLLKGEEINSSRKTRTIYEYFKGYTKEEVDAAIAKLTIYDRNIITLKFGEDLPAPYNSNINTKETSGFYSIKNKIKRLLKDPNGKIKGKNRIIYEYLDGFTKEEVDKVIEKLPQKDKEFIKVRFGESLEVPFQANLDNKQKKEFRCLLVKLRRQLEKPKHKRKTRTQTIYEYFGEFTKEAIDIALSELSPEKMEIIRLKYGDDLSIPPDIQVDKEQNKRFYNLAARIRLQLGSDYSNYKKTLNQRTTDLTETTQEIISTHPKEINKEDCIKMLELIKGSEFNTLTELLTVKEAIIASLRFGLVDGKYFTKEAISNFLGIDVNEVVEASNKALTAFTSNLIPDESIDRDIPVKKKVLPSDKKE